MRLAAFLLALCTGDGADGTLLLHGPALADDAIVFDWGGDLWSVGREGGSARRLTVHPGHEAGAHFAPDGKTFCFTGQYESDADVYVMPASGGEPRRLTFTGGCSALGFTPDGAEVVFLSGRLAPSGRYGQLFTVPVGGGAEKQLPPPMAFTGSFAPDGKRIAYTPLPDSTRTWKRYRGGTTPPIWLFDMATHDIEEIPREGAPAGANFTDTRPVWAGDTVYFLSDRDGTKNVYAFDTKTRAVKRLTAHTDAEVKSFDVRGGSVVYEQGARLHRLDVASGRAEPLVIRCDADLPATRRRFVPAAPFLADAGLSPTGARAVIEARGDLFTVPTKKGDVRDLTHTPGVHERAPAWSPDGKWIAGFTDADGECALWLWPQDGLGAPRKIALGDPPSFYYSPRWSPDGKRLAFTDKRLNVWMLELDIGVPVLVDTDTYDQPERTLDPAWSPDGQWLAYTKRLANHFRSVFLWNVVERRATAITDSATDAASACFTRDGKHLCYLGNETFGLNVGWLDMSSYERPLRSRVHVVVLDATAPSPLAPESDEEKVAADAPAAGAEAPKADATKSDATKSDATKAASNLPATKVDFAGLDQRDLVLPIPARPWSNLQAADGGRLFLIDAGDGAVVDGEGAGGSRQLWRYDFGERKAAPFLPGVGGYALSADGKKLLWSAGGGLGVVDVGGAPKPGDGALDLSAVRSEVDPRAEWKEMFEEVVRLERDFFYVKNLHGADWPAITARARKLLDHVASRRDLNDLFADVIGELVVGHAYVSGGDLPELKRAVAGLLGCDFALVDGRYRIQGILHGWNWDLDARAPLTLPGVKAADGDFLLAVDGREVKGSQNVFEALLGTAGRQTVLTLGKSANDPAPWTTTVVPVASESSLRLRGWIEGNRRKVDALSKGRVAYVYMPNTAGEGYTGFNRDYFSHLDREAVVIDERFNGGGSVADYVIDLLRRPLLSMWATREGREFPTPAASIFGPKAMIINEFAGSGGDAMPAFFRRAGLGKLVGRRTWGGLVGIYDYPPLLDGGSVTAPRLGIYSPDGQWEVENVGVPPDIDVLQTPRLVLEGHDPQLEKAVEVVLAELEKNPVKLPPRPADPVRVR